MGKLMKYEMRSMMKTFIPLWIALLAVALLNGLMSLIDINMTSSFLASLPVFIPAMLYAALCIAVVVLAILFIIQRFYNGLLKDEGYLMFTLPVKTWQLVTAKGLTATIVTVISGMVGILSVFVLVSPTGLFKDFFQWFPRIWTDLMQVPLWYLLVIESVVLIVVTILEAVYEIYAAMAIGHLAKKHRVGWSFVAYIGISIVLTFLMSLFGAVQLPDIIERAIAGWSDTAVIQLMMIGLIVVTVIQAVAFFIITERILSKRLNLE